MQILSSLRFHDSPIMLAKIQSLKRSLSKAVKKPNYYPLLEEV
jgi:hypothetical protein